MDDEARARLIAEATAQQARSDIKRARANLPLGIGLMLGGIALVAAVTVLPVPAIGTLIGGGIGFVAIPGGVAVIVKSLAAIAAANRQLRDLQAPTARVVTR